MATLDDAIWPSHKEVQTMLNMKRHKFAAGSPQDVPKCRAFFRQSLFKISKHKLYKEKQDLYSAPSGFTPWRELLSHLLYFEGSLPAALNSGAPNCESEAGIASSYALYHDSPIRNISRNLGEAFLRTSTKGVIKPPMALEHFIINLPVGLLFDEWKNPLKALLVMTGTCFSRACARHGITLKKDADSIGMDGWDGLYTIGFCDYGPAIIDTTSWGNLHRSEPDLNPFCVPGYKSETHAACSKMRQISVHSLLTMAYRPELISESKSSLISSGHSFRDLGKHKQVRNNIWIGEGFVSKTRKRLESDDREGSPVASHWRRGHWHTYLVGSKREKKTLKWIEPIHVNAEAL